MTSLHKNGCWRKVLAESPPSSPSARLACEEGGSDRASHAQMQQIPLSSSVSPSVFTGVSMGSSRASVVHQRIFRHC